MMSEFAMQSHSRRSLVVRNTFLNVEEEEEDCAPEMDFSRKARSVPLPQGFFEEEADESEEEESSQVDTLPSESRNRARLSTRSLVIRNTFLNVEEEDEDDDAPEMDFSRKARSVPLPPAFFAEEPDEPEDGAPCALDMLLREARCRARNHLIEDSGSDEDECTSTQPLKIPLRADAAHIAGGTPSLNGFATAAIWPLSAGTGDKACGLSLSGASTREPSPTAFTPNFHGNFQSEAAPGSCGAPPRARLQLDALLGEEAAPAQVAQAAFQSAMPPCAGWFAPVGQPCFPGAAQNCGPVNLARPAAAASGGRQVHFAQPSAPRPTTFMIRSLPHSMDRTGLERLLSAEGFGRSYDFIYLPADLSKGGCFGYGFINLVSPDEAERFVQYFDGFSWPGMTQEPIGVHVSEALQGMGQLVDRYRNSPLMHRNVPPGMKPATYRNGILVPFPAPTTRLRQPRVRTSQNRKGE